MCVSEHEGVFAHPHAQIHGDVMEKSRNVTDRVREEKEEDSSPSSASSSSLCFTLLLYLLAQRHKKKEPKNRDLEVDKTVARDGNLGGIIRLFAQSAHESQA